MDRDTLALFLAAALLLTGLVFARRFSAPIKSDEEEIADAIRKDAVKQRERDRLRQLAGNDLEAARSLHQLLSHDLDEIREALSHFRRGRAGKQASNPLITQFAEDERSLRAEIEALADTIKRLRMGSGAA